MEISFYYFILLVNGRASYIRPCTDIAIVLWKHDLKTKLILFNVLDDWSEWVMVVSYVPVCVLLQASKSHNFPSYSPS